MWTPKFGEIKDAEEYYSEFNNYDIDDSFEWKIESVLEVKRKIYQIKKKDTLTKNDKEEIEKLETKIRVLEHVERETEEFVNLVELINIFGRLQRLYEKVERL